MPRPLRTPAIALGLAGAFALSTAHAAPSKSELESARRTFLDAESDEDAGRWADALDKLRAVSDVRLTAGVRYHIALCEEHLGQLVRALGDYESARTQARADGAQDVLQLVGKRLTALDPRVPRLTVHVVPDVPEASVNVDGDPVPGERLGLSMALDPGPHRVEAIAPDRPVVAVVVTLREGDATALELRLADPWPSRAIEKQAPVSGPPTPSAAPAAARTSVLPLSPSPRPARPSAERGGAVAVSSCALALAAVGVAAYVVAGDEHDYAVRTCASLITGSSEPCDSLRNRVRAWDLGAAAAWIGAVATGAIAAVLWAQPARAPAVGARLTIGPGTMAVEGRF